MTTTQEEKNTKPANAPAQKPPVTSIHTTPAAAAADGRGSARVVVVTQAAPGTAGPEKEKRTPRKVFIATGPVHEFKNVAEAEKFLNSGSEQAPRGDFTVIKGTAVEKKQKVSLR